MESRTTGGLLRLHIFPGVDSTSAFVEKRKKKVFVLFKQYVDYSSKEDFVLGLSQRLGQMWDVLCASFTGILAMTSTNHGTTFFVQRL